MIEEVGGKAVAEAYKGSPAKLVRSILRQYATGEGRDKAEGWAPRFLRFPVGSYRDSRVDLPFGADQGRRREFRQPLFGAPSPLRPAPIP
ncbi:hypothetical protein [Enterovirga aerilata]|uniref:Uncharacterized protein n=1 Tax=Enterovirga aerilata TaxID=2730920 RepID=A0A849I2P4_9HYPH|nr:hypothetical protein [Enterovirga sp. DB1703]NNM71628.1 hypothetical protein [Enterovirga sp. DB1703]